MKCFLASLLVVCAAAGSLATASGSEKMELVVGTYREGNNLTEPKPAQSTYFKTTLGAFQIKQGMAAYKWFIEVSKRPEKRLYTRCFIEDPQNPKRAFAYDGFIDPDTPSTTITHGPAVGLKIYQDYTLNFIAYEDKARTKEVDQLTQRIRSYVDTTGPKLKLFQGMKTKTTDSTEEHQVPAEEKK